MHINHRWAYLAAISGIAFILLAFAQRFAADFVRALDVPLAMLVVPFQEYHLVQGFLAITALGDVAGILAIAFGAMVFMRNHPHHIRMLALALIGSTLSANAVKLLVSRMRPETLLWLDPFLSFSFPSGHATASMTLFGFLAVASARLIPKGAGRLFVVISFVGAVLLVGTSRIFLGAHFLSDVIGGWLLGFFWVALVYSFSRRKHS